MSLNSICARLAVAMLILLFVASAQADNLVITRSFSGIWNQPDQDSQGLVLQISEGVDDSKVGVAYWFTYGGDLLSAWYLAVGTVDGDSIPMTLYRASGTGFMEGADNPEAVVEEVGTLTLEFHNCNQGTATYDTPDDVLGSGEFRIQRLTSIYNMRCSGGISDDTPADAKPTILSVHLSPPPEREDITGDGKAKFWERTDWSDFKVEVEEVPDGQYHLQVCGEMRGDFDVSEGEGEIEFSSPIMDSKPLLDFDPRDCLIEVLDGAGVALTSGDAVLTEIPSGPGD